MCRVILLYILLIGVSLRVSAQSYPQGYFQNPLLLPIILAGNFGECRPGHFHSGLDIKTGGHENEPVYAAADGYVSRIKMEPGGFGHGLYITHPNGYTTLYAHLNDFVPAIQRYLRQQQYSKESWTVDLPLSPGQFPVKKGDQIAWSGNTGGSTAPHLHFEIRDTKTEHPLNPQLFGFEIRDEIAPVLKQIAVYDMSNGIYSTEARLFAVKRQASEYVVVNDTITTDADLTGIGLIIDDYMNGSDNTLALYSAEWYLDEILQGQIQLNEIGYEETRYIHSYVDYSLRWQKKLWSQCLFRLPGNRLQRIYDSLNAEDGLLVIRDNNVHRVRIVVKDISGNGLSTNFLLRSLAKPSPTSCTAPAEPGKITTINTTTANCYLDETALYDKVCIDVSEVRDEQSISPRVSIGRPGIPVHHYFDLAMKSHKPIPFGLRSKIALLYSDGKDENGRAASPAQQGYYKASVRAFGDYRLVIDTTAPIIRPTSPVKGNLGKAKSITIRVAENVTSVKSFRGELDGKWILFEQHGDTWTYVFDSHCGKGLHKLNIRASDENGNEARASYTFTR